MGSPRSSNKKKKKKTCIIGSSANKKKKKKIRKDTNKRSHKRWRKPLDVGFKGELKDMRKLSSNDEAFRLPWKKVYEIIDIIDSRKTPTQKTYRHWDQYAVSFYLKMCTCFRVPYQHLEATTQDDNENINGKKPLIPPSPEKIMSLEEQQEQHMLRCGVTKKEGMSYEELMKQEANKEIDGCRVFLSWPFEFGSYSCGDAPDRIPYHLYLLVKEAVDIMKRFEWHSNTNDLMDMRMVEDKIRFFCNFFHSHLPTGWNYHRDDASSLVAGYDPTRRPRYRMAGYTPRVELREGVDPDTCLSEQAMVDVMSTIHSRKTPNFSEMYWATISFYCQLCSCFGIDYDCLEAASEDDVCLMYMGRNG